MWYLDSLIILYCVLGASVIIGRALCRLLPFKQRGAARMFLSPAVGLSIIVLIATLTGWVWGFHQVWCLPPLLVIVAAALLAERNMKRMLAHLVLTFTIATFASAGVLFPILRYNTYSPYNDIFTYIEHGQWLQSHPFRQHGVVSGNVPVVAEVLNYQNNGLRMGASFTLGWVQAIFNSTWSYWVYPATVAVAVTVCSMALAGVAHRFSRRRFLALLIALIFPVTYNGFMYGAVFGFFPMTFGLTMALAWFALYGGILTSESAKWRLYGVIPAATCLAAATLCYNEVVPFSCLAGGIALLMTLAVRPKDRGVIFVRSLITGLLTLALVNVEIFRVIRALRMESDAVVGWGLDWKLWMYPAHMVGLHTGTGDVEAWFVPPGTGLFLILILALAIPLAWAIALQRRKGRPAIDLLPYLLMLVICGAVFTYFRYHIKSPFPVGLGQTWSEFKLSNWAAPAYWALLTGCLAWTSRRGKWLGRAVVTITAIGVVGVGLRDAFVLSKGRTAYIRKEIGPGRDVFATFLGLRDLAKAVPSDQAIYLDLGGDHYKAREMVTYFLDDKKLAGNWIEDCYFFSLPPPALSVPFTASDWIISPNEMKGSRNIGPFYFFPRPATMIREGDVRHGYGLESNGKDWWRWTDGQLDFDYTIAGRVPSGIRISFTYLPAGGPRNVWMKLRAPSTAYGQELKLSETWGKCQTRAIPIKDDTFTIQFVCDQPPVKISDADPRLMSYLIQNLKVEAVTDDKNEAGRMADPNDSESGERNSLSGSNLSGVLPR